MPSLQERDAPEERPWTQHIKPLLEAAIENVNGLRIRGGAFQAIEALDATLRPYPGRKNIIWMTHGEPGVPVDIATTLDRDGITLSSVNQGSFVEPAPFTQLTGGKVYRNDLEKAVKEGIAASHSGYVIEYDAPQPDGNYHKIRVACSRKGVHLQTKQGYYAN